MIQHLTQEVPGWLGFMLKTALQSGKSKYTLLANDPLPLHTYTFGVPSDFLPAPGLLQHLASSLKSPLRPMPGSCPDTVLAKTNAFIDQLVTDGVPIVRGTDMNLTSRDYSQALHLVMTKLACDGLRADKSGHCPL